MTKMLAPANSSGFSFGGTQYPAVKGICDIPAGDPVAAALNHGFTLAPEDAEAGHVVNDGYIRKPLAIDQGVLHADEQLLEKQTIEASAPAPLTDDKVLLIIKGDASGN